MDEPNAEAAPGSAPRLDRLPWTEVVERLRRDARLVVPVGTTLQHGPHLPLSTDTIIVTRVAEELCARREVLLAPTLPYGACSAGERGYAGTAALERKTLHRVLNDLVGTWEPQGIDEILFLTAHGFGPHVSALATAMSEEARIRAIDLTSMDLEAFRTGPGGPEHAGEIETSLMLHLAPELVRMDRAEDVILPEERLAELMEGSQPVPPPGGIGVVGAPTRATAENGRRIYEHLVETLDERIFAPA